MIAGLDLYLSAGRHGGMPGNDSRENPDIPAKPPIDSIIGQVTSHKRKGDGGVP